MSLPDLDRRPIVVAVAGPKPAGLRYVEPDAFARGSFSDPASEKLGFLEEAVAAGYTVLLCFIGLADPALSEDRVAMRVSQGGHDVPSENLRERFPRSLANLREAVNRLPLVHVYDNSDLAHPYRRVATLESGTSFRV